MEVNDNTQKKRRQAKKSFDETPPFEGTFRDLLSSDLQLIVTLLKNNKVSFTDKQYRDCLYSKFAGGISVLQSINSNKESLEEPPINFKNWAALFWFMHRCHFLPLHDTPILLYISRNGCGPCARFNAIWEQIKDNKVIKKSVRCVKIELVSGVNDLHPLLGDTLKEQMPEIGTPCLICVEPQSFFTFFDCIKLIPFQDKNNVSNVYLQEEYDYRLESELPSKLKLSMIPYGYREKDGKFYRSEEMIFQYSNVYEWINRVKYDIALLREQEIGKKHHNNNTQKHGPGYLRF